MDQYHKIQTVFKRDPATKHKTLLEGDYSMPELAYLADNEWEFTEKIDGTNIRVMFEPADHDHAPRVTFGGKTDAAQIPARLVTHLQEKFPADKMSHAFDHPTCLYGEGCGAKIQKGGGKYYKDQRFVLFDVRVGDWWLKRDAVEEIASALNVPVVPIIGAGNLQAMVERCRYGFDSVWGDFRAEGIVARPAVELFTRGGHRIITKLKCKDFPR
ncbi:MAG: hypothetical protein GTN69_10620 [Armatimonadetes bacterium]|nr:hypothetical protein [Armatimonadota bacterium]